MHGVTFFIRSRTVRTRGYSLAEYTRSCEEDEKPNVVVPIYTEGTSYLQVFLTKRSNICYENVLNIHWWGDENIGKIYYRYIRCIRRLVTFSVLQTHIRGSSVIILRIHRTQFLRLIPGTFF